MDKNINLVFLNTCNRTSNIYISKHIINDAKKIKGVNVYYALYANIVETCKKIESPILICLDGQLINKDIIYEAKSYCRSCILWAFEDPYTLKTNIDNSYLFDLVFSNDKNSYTHYGDKGLFLPLAAPSDLISQKEENKKIYDIFFCGTAWPNRVVFLNKLLKDRPNLKFKIILAYNDHTPLLPLECNSSAYVGRISFEDFIAYSRRSRITLNINRCFASSETDESKPANFGPRFYEIASTGSIQLIDNIDNSNIIDEFKETETYTSYQTLLNKIDSILNNFNEYQNKQIGLKRNIENNHTYINRVTTIIEKVCSSEVSKIDTIKTKSTLAENKKSIVFVVHNIKDSSKFGGLEVHQESIANNLKQNFKIYYFTVKEYNGEKKAVLLDTNYKVIESSEKVDNFSNDNISHPVVEKMFSKILIKHHIKLVHFFHFINNCPSLCEITHSLSIPYTISIHDFYCICRQFNLLNYEGKYCNPSSKNKLDCDLCLKKMYGFQQNSFSVRSNYFFKILTMAEKICFISFSSMKIFYEKFYKIEKYFSSNKIYYAPFPNNIYRYKLIQKKEITTDETIKYVVLGNFYHNKGAMYFLDAMYICPNVNAEFHFWGQIDEKVKKTLMNLSSKVGMFYFHGPYKPGEIDLSEYHFSLHLSIWPETYCQTLSEAWAADIIPIVTDIGALGERVKDQYNGFKVDFSRPASLVELFVKIDQRKFDFNIIHNQINNKLYIDQKQHANNYLELFEKIIDKHNKKQNYSNINFDPHGFDLNLINIKHRSLNWNKNFYNIFNKDTIYPVQKLFSPIIKFDGELIISKGSIDKVDNQIVKNLDKEYIFTIKNDDKLRISGWCAHPVDDNYIPVALLENNEINYYIKLSICKRPDLVEYTGDDNAILFGIYGEIQLLNPTQYLIGYTKLTIGWLSVTKNLIYFKSNFINLKEVFYA